MHYDLAPYDANSPYLKEAAWVYQTVWGHNSRDSFYYFKQYAAYRGFHGLVALVDGRVVGTAFGTAWMRDIWWHDKLQDELATYAPWLSRSWVLTELAVLTSYRNQHIGLTLHNALLEAQPNRHVVLSTQTINHAAQRFYERHGWHYLHRSMSFVEGNPPFAIMHKRHYHQQPSFL